jgi:putative transposase
LVVMFRAYKFVLKPTVAQARRLDDLLAAQCELYNAALEERRGAWRWNHRQVTRFEQFAQLSTLRPARPEVMAFGVTVARGTLTRLDLAFQAFHRRVRAGQTPGYPRFRSRRRFDSVSYPDRSGWKLDGDARRFYARGVGHIKVRLHRPLRGVPKTATVAREGRRWVVVVFCAGVESEPLPMTGRTVGIDVGVANLVATSGGELIANPRAATRMAARVTRAQRALATKRRGSANRRRAVSRVGGLKRREANIRRDHAHQLSRRLVNAFDVICYEDLRIANMVRSARGTVECPGVNVAAKAGLNRSIHDAGWAQLLRFVSYKAEGAGRELVAVNAAYTSQTCSSCGHVARDNRPSQAEFCCQGCGHVAHADVNAAINIHRAGLAQRRAYARHEVSQQSA